MSKLLHNDNNKTMLIQMVNNYVWISKHISNDYQTIFNSNFELDINSKWAQTGMMLEWIYKTEGLYACYINNSTTIKVW